MILLKFSITTEKTATPKKRIKAHKSLSASFLGWKSPNPTVDKDVNEK